MSPGGDRATAAAINLEKKGAFMNSLRQALLGAGMLIAASGLAVGAANATTIALVTINQQALFFN